jgi:hypothetical protein
VTLARNLDKSKLVIELSSFGREERMQETPRFIQGVFAFKGAGLREPTSLEPPLTYKVPFDKRAQLVYLRAGNSCAEMIVLVLSRARRPMRYFAIGAKAAIHVPLAIIEDIEPDTEITLSLGAPNGLEGDVMIDLGLVEL